MGMEKQGSKSGGFLQLFDWNRKSRKKLFSSNQEFPEGSKQGKRSSSNFPVLRPHLIDDDDNGRSSIKGSSDYSCSSSVTDEEGNGVKAPGVVARLMGLDSLPTSSVTESFSTPFFDSRSLRDSQYQRTHELLYERQFMHSGKQLANTRLEVYSRNNVDSKSQKLMNRPIERFQTEILPPKSAKSISFTHNKLFSPIKSPGYIPTKNAAQIMEQAAKIIEPGPQIGGKGKMPLVGPSIPLKLRDLTEKMGAVQRSSKFLEVTEKPVDSKAIKHLKGQSLNKSWNGEEAPKFRSYPPEESNAAGLKVKGKSISLAVQAKVNVQKRGGLSSTSSLSLQGKKEHKDMKSNQPLRNQSNSQKIMQKKSSTPNASSVVLRQNNQKQNSSINRDKLPSKPGLPNQQSRKTVSLEASVGQNKPLSKVVLNSKVGQRKNGFGTNDTEKAPPASVAKKYTRKKRVMEEDSYNERGGIGDTVLVNKDEKPIQPSVAIEGHSKWMDDNRRKGMDVVSFTFTSPMKKHVSGSQASGTRDEKHANFGVGFGFEKSSADKNMTKLSSLGLNVIGGDALNILLEQKLRELMGGIESSSSNSNKSMEDATSASIQADSVSDSLSSTAMECDKNSQLRLQRNNHIYESNCFSTEADMLQGIEETDEKSVDSGKARKGFNCRDPSPVSILEPCLSNESCITTDSVDSNSMNDSLQCSSTQSQLVGDSSWSTRNQSVEADNELSDSASSTCTDNCNRECQKKFSLLDSRSRDIMELEYVREVISNADFLFKDFALGQSHEIVNPHLFDQLENQKARRSYSEDNGGCRLSRRLLFDCVGECLDLRCQSYTSGSYKKWVKGEAMMQRKGWLAEEIYREISGLRSMGDWMLDDLVDKDMSTGLGKWLDFEKEEFEVGEEIGRKILSCLVDEVVGDILLF